ncbi:MAG: NUDIX domain-containing protein [Pirellulales bacterium]|nr:NUDIX domain-containing protein [Pirellulales bacterium]
MNNGQAAMFHYLARAIIRDGDQVLLAHSRGAKNTFLPGGHIESGEGARQALAREVHEELGVEATIGRFIGAVEHAWARGQTHHFEINLVFEVEASELHAAATPDVGLEAEPGLEFFWSSTQELGAHNLQPAPLIDWLNRPDQRSALWGSTIE